MFVRLLILLWQCEWYVTSVPVGLGEVVFLTFFSKESHRLDPLPVVAKKRQKTNKPREKRRLHGR